jgi:hypothetical protein
MISLSHKWKQLYGLSTPRDGENAKYVESGRGGGGRGRGIRGDRARGLGKWAWEQRTGHGKKGDEEGNRGMKNTRGLP